MLLPPGTVVGQRWSIGERIGHGGAGVVYRAQHVLSRRPAALKLIHPHLALDRVAMQRFQREASLAAEIAHEGIVAVLDAGVDASTGSLYLAMELLEGESLRRRMARPGTTRVEALALVRQILPPLAAAHARGVVHRDLKPENVFVLADDRIKLLDFGLARPASQESLTMTGAALGTPHYMAPESVMSAKSATPAADVWAMGVMLFEVVAGRLPFGGPTPHAVLVSACIDAHAVVREIAPDVGPALAALVDRCLAKKPELRPADAAVLDAELTDALRHDPPLAPTLVHASMPPPSTGMEATLSSDARTEYAAPSSRDDLASRDSWRKVAGEGWSIEVPQAWAQRETMLPGVVAMVVHPEKLDGAEVGVRIKLEPFEGNTRAFVELGMTNMDAVATIHRTTDARLGGIAAVEVEATFHSADPPFRSLHRAAAAGGLGRVVVAFGPIARFAEIAPVLRAVLDSVRFDVPPAAS